MKRFISILLFAGLITYIGINAVDSVNPAIQAHNANLEEILQ